MDGDSSVLFPFGFGLSYATFRYSPPTLNASAARANATVTASVTVLNNGTVDGAAVVQVYAGAAAATPRGTARNQRKLVGFTKLRVGAGQRAVAVVPIQTNDLAR